MRPPRKQQANKALVLSFELESRLAASHFQYAWRDYQALPGSSWWAARLNVNDDKASILVAYRLANIIDGIHQGGFD